jgi:hypothetical protein
VAKSLKLSLADYQEMLSDGGGHQLVYYEDFHDDDGNDSFLDRYAVDDDDPLRALLDTDFRQAVIDAIDALPPREKILMGLYYEEELNLKEIGAVLGVSESRVSQLHTQAVARLRASLKGAGMDWASLIGLAWRWPACCSAIRSKAAGLLAAAAGRLRHRRGRHLRRRAAAVRGAHLPPRHAHAALGVPAAGESRASRCRARSRCGAIRRAATACCRSSSTCGTKDLFVQKGLRLVVDGIHPDKLRGLLETEITAYEFAERQAARIWESAAGYAPTIGILGAVLGLIHVMENLSDPARWAPASRSPSSRPSTASGWPTCSSCPIGNKLKSHRHGAGGAVRNCSKCSTTSPAATTRAWSRSAWPACWRER